MIIFIILVLAEKIPVAPLGKYQGASLHDSSLTFALSGVALLEGEASTP